MDVGCSGWNRGDVRPRAQSPVAVAREDSRLGVEGCARAASGGCRGRRARGARFRGRFEQQPNGSGSLASLGHGLVLGGELGQERTAACGCARGVAILMAKIKVKAHPFAVVGTLGWWHPHPVQPPLKVSPYFWGNRLHGNAFGSHRPPLGACLEQGCKSLGEASRKLVKTGLYNRSRAE
jgi:hypothetical protein